MNTTAAPTVSVTVEVSGSTYNAELFADNTVRLSGNGMFPGMGRWDGDMIDSRISLSDEVYAELDAAIAYELERKH